MQRKQDKFFSFVLLSVIVFAIWGFSISGLASLPLYQQLEVGEKLKIPLTLPEKIMKNIQVLVESEEEGLLKIDGVVLRENRFVLQKEKPVAVHPGKFDLQLSFMGVIPLQRLKVNIVSPLEVLPGGHSIGILLEAKGAMVVGYSTIVAPNGSFHDPARQAGIKIGDIIRTVNGNPVNSDVEIARTIDDAGNSGKSVFLEIERDFEIYKVNIKPIYCSESKSFRIGLFIRGSTAGLGTLTFYEPLSGIYGALGHLITEPGNRGQIDQIRGYITEAVVRGVQQGRKGQPGEKIGMVLDKKGFSGSIEKNSPYGIFGKLDQPLKNDIFRKPIPVAYANQIKRGPAKILTVINGGKIEEFKIEIENILTRNFPGSKGLVIKITDPRLLSITGGIVQGMSGSPIIQNGRIVGAVTHVLVNDPTRGYGVLAEWMLLETGIIKKETELAG